MKYITTKEAKKYIALKEDYLCNNDMENAEYFTLVELKDGWDKITYYSEREKSTQISEIDIKKYGQFVYCLTNPTLPGIIKIGYTKLNPIERAKQISSGTGVLDKWTPQWYFGCNNGIQLEGEVHKKLKSVRYQRNKEHFVITLKEAILTIEEIGKNYR